MEGIEVVFLDQTGAKRVRAKVSPTVAAKQIIPTVITRMSLPTTSPDGTPMSYALDHKEGGKRLTEDDTLASAGVRPGEHLIVYPEIVAGIDTLEYQRLIGALDQDIEKAKQEHEEREWLERLAQRRKLLIHWQQGLQSRKELLVKYQGKPSVDIDAKLSEIQVELERLALEAASGKPIVASLPMLDLDTRRELAALIDEVNSASPGLPEVPFDERILTLRLWSARWRLLTLRAGESVVSREGIFKAGFAAIANARDQAAPTERLPALGQHALVALPHWEEQIRVTAKALQDAVAARERDEAAAKRAEDAISELVAFLQAVTPKSDEEFDTLRHLVRKAASFPHLRGEVAVLCEKLNDKLMPDFRFLWPKEEKEEEEPQKSDKLTLLEIASRICRRLRKKSMVGACHAPWDMVSQGFAGHDYGRAEETMDAMAKVGILRKRRTGIGIRVSIEPTAVQQADLLIEGKPSGIASLDGYLWCGG